MLTRVKLQKFDFWEKLSYLDTTQQTILSNLILQTRYNFISSMFFDNFYMALQEKLTAWNFV